MADSGGGAGGPAPPLGKPKNVKGLINGKLCSTVPPPTESRWLSETTEKFCYYPPPPLNRVGFWRPRKHAKSATTPPPTESRRFGTSHERGRLFRKILDLRLIVTWLCILFTIMFCENITKNIYECMCLLFGNCD